MLSLFLNVLSLIIISSFVIMEGFFNTSDFSQIVFHILNFESLLVTRYTIVFAVKGLVCFVVFYLIFYRVVFRKFSRKQQLFMSIFLFMISLLIFYIRYDLSAYIKDLLFYEINYINPKDEGVTFEKNKKNIIILYIESLEDSYRDEKIFGMNLLPNLSELQDKYTSIGSYEQMPGTGWTIAGIISTSCGLPVMYNVNSELEVFKTGAFFSEAVCLQNILEHAGYRQYSILGSDKRFTNYDKFLSVHAQRTKIIDINNFCGDNSGNVQWTDADRHIKDLGIIEWGIRDREVYAMAKDVISQASRFAPFMVTVRTLDTHPPYGYLDEQCQEKYHDFRDIILCADEMAAEFVYWAEQQDWFDETIILIIGDHLAMDNPLYNRYLESLSQRRIFNLMISPRRHRFDEKRNFTAFDVFPTLLREAGAVWNGGKLALGTALQTEEKNLFETYSETVFKHKLQRKNFLYRKLYKVSDFPAE